MSLKISSISISEDLKNTMEKVSTTDFILSEYCSDFTINQKLFTYATIVVTDELQTSSLNWNEIKSIVQNVRLGVIKLGNCINTYSIFCDDSDTKDFLIGLAFQIAAYKSFKTTEGKYSLDDKEPEDLELFAEIKQFEQEDALHSIVSYKNFEMCADVYNNIFSENENNLDNNFIKHIQFAISSKEFTSSLLSLEPIFDFDEDAGYKSVATYVKNYLILKKTTFQILNKYFPNYVYLDNLILDSLVAEYLTGLFLVFSIEENPFINEFVVNNVIVDLVAKDQWYNHPSWDEDAFRAGVQNYVGLYSNVPLWLRKFNNANNPINNSALLTLFSINFFYFYQTGKRFYEEHIEEALELARTEKQIFDLVTAMSFTIFSEFNKIYNLDKNPIDNQDIRKQATEEFYAQQHNKQKKHKTTPKDSSKFFIFRWISMLFDKIDDLPEPIHTIIYIAVIISFFALCLGALQLLTIFFHFLFYGN